MNKRFPINFQDFVIILCLYSDIFIKFQKKLEAMRILVQRVFQSWVKVGGIQISRIKQGILVLVGMTHDDNSDVADHMVSKILNMRLWEKDEKSWNASVMEIGGQVMVVSQFTLYGMLKGNKPDFHSSMEADKARILFNYLVQQLGKKYNKQRIQTGKFQALMEVGSVINGPVTIHYQKPAQEMPKKKAKPEIIKQKKQEKGVSEKVEETQATKQKVEKKEEQTQEQIKNQQNK